MFGKAHLMSYLNSEAWIAATNARRPSSQYIWLASFCGQCGNIVIPKALNIFSFQSPDPRHPILHGIVCPSCNSHNVIVNGSLKGRATSLN